MSKIDSPAELQEQNGRCIVGVHLDVDSLRVVEVSRGRVARWASVPYPPDVAPGTPEFPAFLKKNMADFHSAFHRTSLWVVGPLPSLQVRFLSLPKTRPRQLPNLVYWTFRKEIPFDPVQTIFDYDTEGDAAAGAAKKTTDATAYTVSRGDVDALMGQFEAAGLPVDGVVIPSFALRNLFGVRSLAHVGPALGLYAGSDSSALLFFKGKQVIAHRVFKTGMNVVLDVLRDRYPDWSQAKTYRRFARRSRGRRPPSRRPNRPPPRPRGSRKPSMSPSIA
jgi:Tfp pilus assembly PilM family ATPase